METQPNKVKKNTGQGRRQGMMQMRYTKPRDCSDRPHNYTPQSSLMVASVSLVPPFFSSVFAGILDIDLSSNRLLENKRTTGRRKKEDGAKHKNDVGNCSARDQLVATEPLFWFS
jgi:hypothetical protein